MSREQEMTKIMTDPVLWVEKHIGKPRWYQEQILRHPHHRIALRCGRRLGKCIAGNQRIVNPHTGAYRTVEDLYHNPDDLSLFTLDAHYKTVPSQAVHIEHNGEKETFTVRTKHGEEVTLTGNHPLLTIHGWKDVDDIAVGEFIATPKEVPVFGNQAPGISRAKMMGYLTGGTQRTKTTPVLNISEDSMIDTLLETSRREEVRLIRRSKQAFVVMDDKHKYQEAAAVVPQRVPDEVFEYDKTHLAVFLAAFFDVNGWTYVKRVAEIGFGTKYTQLSKDIKHLLLRFGIQTNVLERKVKDADYLQNMIYSKRDILKFVEKIAVYAQRDYSDVAEKVDSMSELDYRIPKDIWTYIDDQRKNKGLKKYEVTGDKKEKFRTHINLTEEKARRYAQNLDDEHLADLATSDVKWEEVVAITPAGIQETYDVSVPETHNLIVEDVYVHNTWTMAAHMLWGVFTGYGGTVEHEGTTVVVATPYENQARIVFDMLLKFINENDVLKASVERTTQSPFLIELKNGGRIKLFTAGTKSGGGGDSMRGQAADYVYMDN